MKNILPIVLFLALFATVAHGQICTPDPQYTEVGVYPETFPDGTVGQPYSEVLQFVLPTDTMGYDFTNFLILSVSLPVGLQWECSNAFNGCNYNPQVSVNGCGLVFGTPLIAGEYIVDVNVVADLTAISGVPFSFQLPMTILPFVPNSSNDGFSMTGALGCSPVVVSFENNNPGLNLYQWDFGNGNTSTLENPTPQLYMQPGAYPVSYSAYDNTDTLDVYTFTGLSINSMSGYGGGFPSFETADPYFILLENNNPVYQSPIIMDTNPPVSWQVSINLNPGSTYAIQIWEADESAGEVWFFGDDYMGQTTLNLNGCNSCNVSGGDGAANISYTVSFQQVMPFPVVLSLDTVYVYAFPQQPIVTYDDEENIMSTTDLGYFYQWYFNGQPISSATQATHTPTESGMYAVAAFSLGGCSEISEDVLGVVCIPEYVPTLYTLNGQVILSNPLPGGVFQWFINDVALEGSNGTSVDISIAGNYSITVVDPYACEYLSAPLNISSGVGIDNAAATPDWVIYPNPTYSTFNVDLKNGFRAKKLTIVDLTGRVIFQLNEEKPNYVVNTTDWEAGVYFVQLVGENKTYTKRIVKK
jgi:hypothetical protein